MKIDITIPKDYSFRKLVKNANYYFGKKGKHTILFKDNQYYVYLNPYGMQIKLISKDEIIQNELKNYLEFMFEDSYIGILKQDIENLPKNLKNIKIYEV